ncbi:MAG TPA: NADH-quinone oxidoreductase subunit N [Planctomycetaceae bacterium]|jgi:NADH-quinone oxidoreductase subunit N|nr:NADH-quinone oxidoreductase subunit N [Planctomycetaceae bacterium]
MSFDILLGRLIQNTTQVSLVLFLPELTLCATIVVLLLVRLCNLDRIIRPVGVSLVGGLIALGIAGKEFYDLADGVQSATPIFTGLLAYDQFTVFFRLFLITFVILVTALTALSGIPDLEDGPDFYTLLFGATIGMLLMASTNNLLILFLGIEMASVPSYAMVGFLKGRRKASEASLKFVVYGAGAAGVLLYGVSLLSGLTGTADFTEMALRISQVVGTKGMSDPTVRTMLLGILMVLVGLAFKLSIVPFHFWCPDAFEGAAAEVAGYLSIASKAAAFALLVRFCRMIVGDHVGALANLNYALGIGLGLVAALTATFGNLAAYSQKNVKRLLAYSTIAHAGYMLMAVAAMMVILNGPHVANVEVSLNVSRAIEGLLYYLCVYMFMNLGAFAVVALVRNEIFSEEIDDYNGLAQQAPRYCLCMAVCLFSLIGLPPFGGFFAKWAIFSSLLQAGYVSRIMWVVLVIGGVNTVFSLFYYLRVLKAMYLTPRPEGARRTEDALPAGAYVLIIALPVLLTGIGVTPVLRLVGTAAAAIFQWPHVASVAQLPHGM